MNAYESLLNAYDFAGKTAVITGGTGVLGAEIVRVLALSGAKVAVLHLNREAGGNLVKSLGPEREQVRLFRVDVCDQSAMQERAAEITKAFGRVDILINGAGGNKKEATTNAEQHFFDISVEALRWVFELNVAGTIIPCQVFGRVMAEQGEGVILNFSSMAADRPLTRIVAYSAAKAAVNSFTQWLAVHMAREYSPKIRVNAVAPGFFLTKQNRFLLTDRETGELTPRGRDILSHTPMARFGDPSDLIGAVLWLLSPASQFVTGTVVAVDGGFSAFSGV